MKLADDAALLMRMSKASESIYVQCGLDVSVNGLTQALLSVTSMKNK